MSDLSLVMQAMADQIRTAVAAATDVDVQVEPKLVWNPTPPCIDIYPGDPSRDPESAGFRSIQGGYLFTVRARVGTPDHEAGQELLLNFLDDEDDLSIARALNTDRKLGGRVNSLDVQSVTGYVMFPAANNEGAWLGATWTVLVLPQT